MRSFWNEQTVELEGETYRLVLNFAAIDAAEAVSKVGFSKLVENVESDDPKTALACKLIWALLREHHAEITLDQAANFMFGGIGLQLGQALRELLQQSFNAAEKPKGKNPPQAPGTSATS